MQALIDVLAQHHAWSTGLLFAVALLGSVLLVGTFVPGSSVVFAAGMLVGDAWMFLGTTADVLASDALTRLDQVVFTGLQQLRTGVADRLMIAATELGINWPGAHGPHTCRRKCWAVESRPCAR